MITFVVRRVVPLVGIGALLALIIQLQAVPEASADVWFHLRFGREFIEGWSIANPGHLGVYDTAKWVPTQWLGQVLMSLIDARLGTTGIIWASGVAVMVVGVLLYCTCRILASSLPAALVTCVAVLAALPGMAARPQLFSYVLIIVTTAAWLATQRDGKPRYWLIALAWLWPMLHGMWPVGITISVAAVLGLLLDGGISRKRLAQMAAIPLLSGVVAVLTPVGTDLVRAVIQVSGRSKYFVEWGPANFMAPPGALLLVLIAAVLVTGLRTQPSSWVHTTFALLALAWALYSLRTAPVAALIIAPLAAAALQRIVPDSEKLRRPELVVVFAMLAIASAAMAQTANALASERPVPAWVDSRLDALPAETRILNDWDSGSYLLFRHPDLYYVMHGYGDVFTDAELERNLSLVRLTPGWVETIEDLDAEVALVDADSSLGYALANVLGWDEIEGDGGFVFLTPPALE